MVSVRKCGYIVTISRSCLIVFQQPAVTALKWGTCNFWPRSFNQKVKRAINFPYASYANIQPKSRKVLLLFLRLLLCAMVNCLGNVDIWRKNTEPFRNDKLSREGNYKLYTLPSSSARRLCHSTSFVYLLGCGCNKY